MSLEYGIELDSGIHSPVRVSQTGANLVAAVTTAGTAVDLLADDSGNLSIAALAGERNTSSATNNYIVVRDEANLTVVSQTTAVTIGAGAANDTHLIGVLISTVLVGTCVIAGFADAASAAQSITLPVGSVGFMDFRGAINSAGALTVTCSNASDDNSVSVLWRPR